MTLQEAKKYLKQLRHYKRFNDELTPIPLPVFDHKKAKKIVKKSKLKTK